MYVGDLVSIQKKRGQFSDSGIYEYVRENCWGV